jgi:hypothetical protein
VAISERGLAVLRANLRYALNGLEQARKAGDQRTIDRWQALADDWGKLIAAHDD